MFERNNITTLKKQTFLFFSTVVAKEHRMLLSTSTLTYQTFRSATSHTRIAKAWLSDTRNTRLVKTTSLGLFTDQQIHSGCITYRRLHFGVNPNGFEFFFLKKTSGSVFFSRTARKKTWLKRINTTIYKICRYEYILYYRSMHVYGHFYKIIR